MPAFGSHPTTGRWDPTLAGQQFQEHVQNIIAKHNVEAPRELRESGARWYETAHDVASKLGHGNVERGAGVIAALSPMNSWDKNIMLARQLVHTGEAGGYLPVNIEKARRIHGGEDPRAVLGGHKVRSFFENIVDPSSPQHVTIDRHAHDIAMGRPFVGTGGSKDPEEEHLGLSAKGRYKHFSDAYRHASGELGIDVPSRLQAVTWTLHRGTAL